MPSSKGDAMDEQVLRFKPPQATKKKRKTKMKMNKMMSVYDIVKTSLEMLSTPDFYKPYSSPRQPKAVTYSPTHWTEHGEMPKDEDIAQDVQFTEWKSTNSSRSGVMVSWYENGEYPKTTDVVLFDPELWNKFNEVVKGL